MCLYVEKNHLGLLALAVTIVLGVLFGRSVTINNTTIIQTAASQPSWHIVETWTIPAAAATSQTVVSDWVASLIGISLCVVFASAFMFRLSKVQKREISARCSCIRPSKFNGL